MQNLLHERFGDLTTTRDFQNSLRPLEVTPGQVRGHILIVGHGPAAPEQCLVGAHPYTRLYSHVTSVTAIDDEWIFPDFLFEEEKHCKLLKIKPPLPNNRRGIFSGIESFWELGNEKIISPNSLHCILFFALLVSKNN